MECMSPKKSEQLTKLAAVEALVCRDVGRKTQALIHATRGDLQQAATTLADAKSVGLITGFFVPRGDVTAPETDGPVGAALLAAALAACGVPTRIAVDTPCVSAVRAAIVASGGGISVDEVGVDDRPGLLAVVQTWKNAGVTHAVAIERCGRSTDGRPRNMRGVDVSSWTAPLDDLFLAGGWIRVAIGDGGNEIGMGKLPAGMIADNVPMGAKIASVTGCDHLIVAGVSNWGAFGLMASLAIIRPDWSPAIDRILTAARGLDVTRAIVEQAGAVDGVTARSEATVDGFGPEIHSALIDDLRRIAWPAGAH
jgi:D-glutamate cyclase